MSTNNKYVPYEKRDGEKSIVFFTRDLSETGLLKIYDRISHVLNGKIAIKLHTGEPEGPNIIPRPWVRELIDKRLNEAVIIETNTYYPGARSTTEKHLETLKINGWTFCPVDIIDSNGATDLTVNGGHHLETISVGASLLSYDSLLTLTHFKGHAMGGFGGSNKNIGIGCADGKIGKKQIHTNIIPMGIHGDELMERISESTKATIDHFKRHVAYINICRNMSVSCDCEGKRAKPVVTPDIGILASLDILAVDNACMDLIYALPEGSGKDIISRVETKHGLRQLSYMKELGMGNDLYDLIDIDNDDKVISLAEAVADIKPGWKPDKYNTFPGKNKFAR